MSAISPFTPAADRRSARIAYSYEVIAQEVLARSTVHPDAPAQALRDGETRIPQILTASEINTPIHNSMLRSAKQLYGDRLGGSDGEIGHLKDFYFNDQRWIIRYMVVDTGSWLPGRLVLLSPHAFGNFLQEDHCLLVNLTQKQIENSPAIESHKPVTRQYEEEYFRYYGWPSYWQGGEMWGSGGCSIAPPPHLIPAIDEPNGSHCRDGDDPHLRSTKNVVGYHIQTGEGAIGHVIDFMIDDKSWAIRHLVVETGHWYHGKEIALSPKYIERISYEESKVFVNVTKEAIQKAAEYQIPEPLFHGSQNFND